MKTDNRHKILFIISILLLIIQTACKPPYDQISPGDYPESAGEITGFRGDQYGYVVYDIENRKIARGHNMHREFVPASVTKLFTALFAAQTLGTDYTFTTALSYNGDIDRGILTGDIYLKGGGDPELSIIELQAMAHDLKMKGIIEVKGNFYFDESMFSSRELLDNDMPAESYYNTGISPLTLNSNIIYAVQRKNGDGRIRSVDLIPSLPSFSSYLYSEKAQYPFLKFRYSEGIERWGIPGSRLCDPRQQLPVKHPGLFTAQAFHRLCAINGIKLPLPVKGVVPSSVKILSETKSRPLAEIIKNMLYSSCNLTAEMICSISSMAYTAGSVQNSNPAGVMKSFYSGGFKMLIWDNFRTVNASGLTGLNRATAYQTVAVLLFIERYGKENFRLEKILPVSGWDGTMKGRLDQPEAAFRVYAKTGSIFYASALSGVFYADSGKRYLFAVYINDNAGRSAYNAKKEKTEDDLNRGGLWSKKAASSIDQFILKMIKEL